MGVRGRVLSGTPESAAMMQPWIAPAHPCEDGVPFGPDMRTGKLVTLDPVIWKRNQLVHSMTIGVYGEMNSGKSTLMKALALRLMILQGGLDNSGQPVDVKVRINDRKRVGGHPEYEELTKFLNHDTVDLARLQVNIFDPAMNMHRWDILDTAINCYEFVSGQQASGYIPLAIQIAVHKMLRHYGDLVCLEVLENLLITLDLADVNEYFEDGQDVFLYQFDDVLKTRNDLQQRLRNDLRRGHNAPIADIQRDALYAAQQYGRILRGDYDNIFGGNGSIRELLSREALTLDWSNLNERTRILLESIINKWETAAANDYDTSIIPYLRISDEEHQGMKNLMYVRYMSEQIKVSRSVPTIRLSATQYVTDVTRVGEPDSEIRSKAKGIMNHTACHMIGRQPETKEIREDLETLGISSLDLNKIWQLEQGCVAIKLADRAPVFGQCILTPTEHKLVQTNVADEYRSARQPAPQSPAVQERLARKQGTKRLVIPTVPAVPEDMNGQPN